MKTTKKTEETVVDKKIQKHPVIYVLSFIILIIIIVTFIGSPVASKMGNAPRIVFGKWVNKPIVFYPSLDNYFAEQRDMLAKNVEKNSNIDWTNPNNQLQMALQIWRGAFERTVIHTAILWMLEKSSVKVSNNRIDKMLINYGPYLVDGKFSLDRYNNTPVTDRNRYRIRIGETVLQQQYISDFLYGIKTSKNELDLIASIGEKEITLDIAYISFSSFPDSEVTSFAKENMDLFKSTELSKITVLSGKKDAEKIHSMVNNNLDSFSDTAINQSVDSYANIGGDMGRVYNYNLKLELKNSSDTEKVFALTRGEISPVLETGNGWVIYKCNNNPQDFDLSATSSLNIVKNYITIYEPGKIEDYFQQKAMAVKSAENFKSAATQNNFSLYKTSSFPINYRDHNMFKKVEIENAPSDLRLFNYNQDLLEKAFSLKENEVSDPITLGNSVILLSLTAKSENSNFSNTVNSIWPYVLQQIGDKSISSFILTSDKLIDNFNVVFDKYFVNQ